MKARGGALVVAVVVAALAGGAVLLSRRGADDAAAPAAVDGGVAAARRRLEAARSGATGSVAGMVRAGDVPVRGATVSVEVGGAPRVVTTDGFGRFEARDVPLGAGYVEASARFYIGDSRRIDLRTPAGARAAERVDLQLSACTDEIVGDVRDVAGAPLPEAEVDVVDRNGRTRGRTIGDGQGRYALCAPAGFAAVRAQVTGYGAQLRVVQGAGSTRVDFRLGPEVVVEGRVVEEDGERPVAGAVVRVGAPRPIASAVTGEAGEFRVAGLAPGRHALFARSGDGLSTPGPTEVLARVGVATPPVVLRLERAHVLTGRVVDAAGRPVPAVRLTAAGNVPIEAATDEEGRFLLGPLAAGRAMIAIAGVAAVEEREVLVPHEGELVFALPGSAWLRGRVMNKRRPVGGATVRVERGRILVRSRADGGFEVGPLAAGTRLVEAEDGEHGHGEAEVAVAEGEIRDGVVIELSRGATVSGTVVDQRGAKVAGAWVILWSERGAERGDAGAGADGTFTVTGLAGRDTYDATVFPSRMAHPLAPAGEPFPRIPVTDVDSHVEGVRLAVRIERATLAGVVRRPDGEPVADVRVLATDATLTATIGETVTDEHGRFELPDLVGDRLDVLASTGDAVTARRDDVPAGTRDLVLTLPATTSLRGTLAGFTRPPQVTVSVAGPRFVPRYFPTTTENAFLVDDLPAGDYVVRARARGELAEARVTVAAGAEARVTLVSGGAARVVLAAVNEDTGAAIAGALCGFAVASDADSAVVYERTDSGGELGLEAPAGLDLVFACKPAIDAEEARPVRRRLAPGEAATITVGLLRRPYLGLQLAFEGDVAVVAQATGPAAAAGIVPGDAIVAIEGEEVEGQTRDRFFALLFSRAPGATLRLTLRRGDTVSIVVGRRPDRVAFSEL